MPSVAYDRGQDDGSESLRARRRRLMMLRLHRTLSALGKHRMTRPLDDVLVVALEQAVAAPLATRKLADAGARVIKVERPGGDFARGYDHVVHGASSHFVWINRGKESVVVDLKDTDDAAFLHRVIAAADVFIQNLAPGAAARAGFGSRALRAVHPRLITCDVSGYGETGPYAQMKAYDNLVQGETGLQSVTGTPDSPSRVGISICDIAAGMHAYSAIVEALLLRERTGEATALAVTLFDAMADWMSVPYLHWVYGGRAPERTGLLHYGITPYGPFVSRDGEVVLVAVQNEREWVRLCEEVLERPDLAADPRFQGNPSRVAHRQEVEWVVQEGLARFGTDELTQRLLRAGVAFGQLNSVEAFAAHPQLRLMEIETSEGGIRLPADPVVWLEREEKRAPPAAGAHERRLRVPALDEHGKALRSEFRA
jgi:crotonobetainyl-CoA:carnitine CoA-transferase CaiB-like acyl-CoA transferase